MVFPIIQFRLQNTWISGKTSSLDNPLEIDYPAFCRKS